MRFNSSHYISNGTLIAVSTAGLQLHLYFLFHLAVHLAEYLRHEDAVEDGILLLKAFHFYLNSKYLKQLKR